MHITLCAMMVQLQWNQFEVVKLLDSHEYEMLNCLGDIWVTNTCSGRVSFGQVTGVDLTESLCSKTSIHFKMFWFTESSFCR